MNPSKSYAETRVSEPLHQNEEVSITDLASAELTLVDSL